MIKKTVSILLGICMSISISVTVMADDFSEQSTNVNSDGNAISSENVETEETSDDTLLRETDTQADETVIDQGSQETEDNPAFEVQELAIEDPVEENEPVQATPAASVSYQTHVQKIGWQNWVSDSAISGTSGQSKRLEGIHIVLNNQPYAGSILYRTHVQTYGWQDWVGDGAMSGTSGQSKRLEAIQIQLTGEMANRYDVYYQVHAQKFGWLGWAKNGEMAGTSAYSYRLEAIRIVLVRKGEAAPGSTENAYRTPNGSSGAVAAPAPAPVVSAPSSSGVSGIEYQTHVQREGWQSWVSNGAVSGTSGRSLRLEGINIKLANQPYTGSVQYRTHVQTYGWQGWVADGAMSGTSGQSKRLEAIQVQLSGEMANHFDIYYRVHAQKFGWLGWAKNGEMAGTAGYSYRLEAIEIVLVNKGATAPGSSANIFYQKTASGVTSINGVGSESVYVPSIRGMSAANRAVIRNMLGAFETGGQIYGNQNYTIYVGPNTNSTLEKTITLGAFGFYGVNAQRLIANILAKDPAKFRSIDSKGIIEKRLKDNWEQIKWNPNEEQKKVLIALISSDVGRKCQDELLDTMTSDEIRACQNSYTDDTMATMMYVDLAWQGGRGAANRIFNQLNGNYSLDNILEVLKRDQKDDSSIYQLGDTIFWRRRTLCKQWIEKYVVG